jgi:hypothetical protein
MSETATFRPCLLQQLNQRSQDDRQALAYATSPGHGDERRKHSRDESLLTT